MLVSWLLSASALVSPQGHSAGLRALSGPMTTPMSICISERGLIPLRNSKRSALSMVVQVPEKSSKYRFSLGKLAFSGLPLSPEAVDRRKTILKEVVKDTIWTLDQVQGIINVNVPVRCTVVKLSGGGLFVNNPIAPTPEAIEMMRELEAAHGPVKIICLSTIAIEHKGTTGAFSAAFPESEVYLQPGQYAFPVNLPSAFFFPLGKTIKEIPEKSENAPWADDFDHHSMPLLKPPGVGGFTETAFFHKATGTLLVTDTVQKIEDEPPAIIQEDPRALLYHARDTMFDLVEDTPASRRRGWRRMVLFGLTFQPSGINVLDSLESLKAAQTVDPEMKKLGEGAVPFSGGFYPWEWVEDDLPAFKALQGGVLVAPILQKLILNREPEKVLAWADRVAKWPIKRIIPCHLANDIQASGGDFRRAFNFLEDLQGGGGGGLASLFGAVRGEAKAPQGRDKDVAFLSDVSKQLTEQGVLFPEAPLVKRC